MPRVEGARTRPMASPACLVDALPRGRPRSRGSAVCLVDASGRAAWLPDASGSACRSFDGSGSVDRAFDASANAGRSLSVPGYTGRLPTPPAAPVASSTPPVVRVAFPTRPGPRVAPLMPPAAPFASSNRSVPGGRRAVRANGRSRHGNRWDRCQTQAPPSPTLRVSPGEPAPGGGAGRRRLTPRCAGRPRSPGWRAAGPARARAARGRPRASGDSEPAAPPGGS